MVSTLPYLTSAEDVLSGELKSEPADFVVEEIPAYLPSGEGEHLFLWIEKRDISAEYLVTHLAHCLRISRLDIGVAGLKDRRAVTRQWVSVPANCESLLPEVSTDAIRVLEAKRHGNKLRTGHLRGNRFEILIRGAHDLETAERLVTQITEWGVPNYYGEQRFGIDEETLTLGLALLRGEKVPGDIPKSRRKFLTRFAVSAAQSSLFNEVLKQRLLSGQLHQVLTGDVMQFSTSRGVFLVADPVIEQQRFDARETVITGPMFGPKMKSPLGLPAEMEQQVLAAHNVSRDVFTKFPKLTTGTRRPLLLWPENLTLSPQPNGLNIAFTLPPGSYATITLREFLKSPSD